MKRLLIILLIAAPLIHLYAQKHTDTIKRVYIPIKVYKEKYQDSIIKYDDVNIRIIEGDTLVRDYNNIKPRGVYVPYVYKDSTFLHYYKKVAFNHKHDSTRLKTVMKYWKTDINIFFSKSVDKNVKKNLMEFAQSISKEVDSLNISEVKKIEDSNYMIYYFGDFDYEARMTNYKKSDFYMHWKNNQIYRCAIKLDSETYFSEKLQKIKLKELFLQSLGRFKLINELDCESYFSNCYSENKKLSELDLEILKYHYSYGICKGTDLKTFEDQHKRAKELLQNRNVKMMFFHPY